MKFTMTNIILLVLLCLMSIVVKSQTPSETIHSALDKYAKQDQFNGIIAIAEDDNVLLLQSVGYADFQNKVKIDQTTSMPLSSLTKTFTAMCIMILAEEGTLNYDDLVKKSLVDFPYQNTTIRHLLSHTSGLKSLYNRAADKDDLITIKGLKDFIVSKKPKLSFKPGAQFQYSNARYCLLAGIIEQVSGKTFSNFLNERIFVPLDMTNSFLLTTSTWDRKKAFSHDKKNRIEDWFLGLYSGATGIYSSVDDMLKWDQALYGEKLISQKAIQNAFKGKKLNDGTITHYGFGWKKWKGQDHLIFQNGDWVGNESVLFRDIDEKRTIIILANRQNGVDKWQLMEEILPVFGYSE